MCINYTAATARCGFHTSTVSSHWCHVSYKTPIWIFSNVALTVINISRKHWLIWCIPCLIWHQNEAHNNWFKSLNIQHSTDAVWCVHCNHMTKHVIKQMSVWISMAPTSHGNSQSLLTCNPLINEQMYMKQNNMIQAWVQQARKHSCLT